MPYSQREETARLASIMDASLPLPAEPSQPASILLMLQNEGPHFLPRGNRYSSGDGQVPHDPLYMEHCSGSKNNLKNQGTKHRCPAAAKVRVTAVTSGQTMRSFFRPSPGCSGPKGTVIYLLSTR